MKEAWKMGTAPETLKVPDRTTQRKIWLLKVVQKSIFWLALATLVVILAIQVAKCLVKYHHKPTYFSTNIVPQSHAAFPAITACPDLPGGYKLDVLQANGFKSRLDYNYQSAGANISLQSNDSEVTPEELFVRATFSPEELFYSIRARYFKVSSLVIKFSL